ncbi:MAG: sulfotransferase family protein [Salinivenus sp.]
MSVPFFIVGASRSGTTLLRLMLNAHSRLGIPREMKYFHTIGRTVTPQSWRDEVPDDSYRPLVRNYLQRRSDLFSEDLDALEALVMDDKERTLRAPYRVLMEYWSRTLNKPRWGEKTPHNLFYVDVLNDMFPGAKFIHVVRDPRAVTQSMNSIEYYSGETVFNALNWRRSIRAGETLLQQTLSSDQQCTIRYEDLVSAPDATLRTICQFLEEAYEPSMLRFYETAAEHMPSTIRTPSIRGPVNEKSLSKWKERLSTFEVEIVESICTEEMDRLGYERSTRPSSSVYARIFLKAAYWHWKSWQHRNQRGYEVAYSFFAGLRARFHRWRPDLFARPQREAS